MGRLEHQETYSGNHVLSDYPMSIGNVRIPLSQQQGFFLSSKERSIAPPLPKEPPNNPVKKSPEEQVIEALRTDEAVRFVEATIKKSYGSCRFFIGHEREAEDMVTDAFNLMRLMSGRSINGGSKVTTDEGLREAFAKIHAEIFKPGVPSFWFQEAYSRYRKERSRIDFAQVREYIRGNRVLDFGSGSGNFALELHSNGYDVFTADPIDYRAKKVKNSGIPFYLMQSPRDIDYPDNFFDTTFIMNVLHHIDEADLSHVLEKLSRVASRLIIKEDLLCGPDDLKRYGASDMMTEGFMEKYLQLSPEQQRKSLIIFDYFGNSISGWSIAKMNMPFQFKTVAEWITLFSQHGFATTHARITGFEEYKLHKVPQEILICDRKNVHSD